MFMVFNVTFNNISATSWQSVLLVEETGENHRPVANHWQTLSHNVVSRTTQHEQGSNSQLLVLIVTDCTSSCKSTYDAITTTTAPVWITGIIVVLSKPNIQLVLETKNKRVSGCHVACTLKTTYNTVPKKQ